MSTSPDHEDYDRMSDESSNMTASIATEVFLRTARITCSPSAYPRSARTCHGTTYYLMRWNQLLTGGYPNKMNLRRFNLLRKKKKKKIQTTNCSHQTFQRWRFLSHIIMLEYHFSLLHPTFKIIGFNVWTFLYVSTLDLRMYPLSFFSSFLHRFFDLSGLIGRGSKI